MRLTDKQVQRFQQIYQKQFGSEIDIAEARKISTQFIQTIKILYQPIPKNNSN